MSLDQVDSVEVETRQTMGAYTLVRELGRGGMGTVFLGEHRLIGRRAAIKVLLPELASDAVVVRRFYNEARLAASVRHPGVIDIYDLAVTSAGFPYIVMEYLDGETLGAHLARVGAVPVHHALRIAGDIADTLAAIHRNGVLHRDLKPENVFVVSRAQARNGARMKLLDFGIAKAMSSAAVYAGAAPYGLAVGTPMYMSPEQCHGARDAGPQSDLYSLGCLMFELLCGRPPFLGDCVADVLLAHVEAPAPSLRAFAPWVPESLDRLVRGLLAKDPRERLGDARQVALHLREILAFLRPTRAPHPDRAALAAAAAVAPP
jgi:eukaryotic-like serine/threonine-protein kinase